MPTILDRLRGLFSPQTKSPALAAFRTRSTLSWSMGQPATSAYAQEGFERNALIYAAIMHKARAISQVPLTAYDREDIELPVTHPLRQRLLRPNRYQSSVAWLQQLIVYLNTFGNAYVYEDASGEMYNLRPDRVRIVPGKSAREPLGYLYNYVPHADPMPILADELMHLKMIHPLDDLEGLGYGLSPLAAAGQAGDVDNEITAFLKRYFENGTVLGGVLKFEMPLGDDDVARARRRWQELYGGVQHWGEIAVLDSGGDFKAIVPSLREMSFDILDDRNEARLLMVLGVPGMLIGARSALERSTFSNYEEANRVFWQNTFLPDLRMIEEEMRWWFDDPNGHRPGFDVSRVPALQEDIAKQVDAAHKLWTMGVPRVDALELVGLRAPSSAKDDVSYVPMGMQEADLPTIPSTATPQNRPLPAPSGTPPEEDLQDETPPEDEDEEPEEETAAADPVREAKAGYMTNLADQWQARFQALASEALEADMRAVLAFVEKGVAEAIARKATVDWLPVLDAVSEYFAQGSQAIWRGKYIPAITGIVSDAGSFWASNLGVGFDVEHVRATAWFQTYTLQFAQPIAATSSEQISALLREANEQGRSIGEVSRGLEQLFRGWMKQANVDPDTWAWANVRLPSDRTEMIARTEITRAMGGGTQALFRDWGVAQKEWLSTADARCRPSHLAANGQTVPVDQPFMIGGYPMMHPGDMELGAPVSEIVNCRCTMAPVSR